MDKNERRLFSVVAICICVMVCVIAISGAVTTRTSKPDMDAIRHAIEIYGR